MAWQIWALQAASNSHWIRIPFMQQRMVCAVMTTELKGCRLDAPGVRSEKAAQHGVGSIQRSNMAASLHCLAQTLVHWPPANVTAVPSASITPAHAQKG